MSEDLIFYTNPQSRGRIIRWMLEEVGAPYQVELVGFGPAMKSPAYRAVNPMGKVPALKHGDHIVTECAAICAYLADAFPAAGLAPPPTERADYYRWMFFTAGPFEAATTNQVLAVEVPGQLTGMVGYGSLELAVDALEGAVAGRRFIAGDRFSAADVYVGSHIQWGLEQKSLEPRPAFVAYWAGLEGREARRRANALDNAAVAAA